MAQLVVLPQLVQQLLFLHGAALQLPLEAALRLSSVQQRLVELTALAAELFAAGLQRQLVPGQLLQLLPQGGHLLLQFVQTGLALGDLCRRLLIVGAEPLRQLVASGAVGGHVLLHAAQLLRAPQGRLLLRQQRRLRRLFLADRLGQPVAGVVQVRLSSQLLLCLTAQGLGVGLRLFNGLLHFPDTGFILAVAAVEARQLLLHALAAQAQAVQ